ALRALGSGRVWVAPSCSLLHVPVDLRLETKLDQELKTWVAFATQKLYEVAALTAAANGAADNVRWLFEANARAIASRRTSPRIHRPEVAQRSEEHTSELQSRENLVCRLLLEKKNAR